MQPAPDKHPEVVYRRTPDPSSAASAERRSGYAPAIAPLVIGFLLLLALILVLGVRSARKVSEVGVSSRQLNLEYSTRLSRLLDLRLKLMALDAEARFRALEESRRELRPPFDFRLDKARDEAREAFKILGAPPQSDDEETKKKETKNWNDLQEHHTCDNH